MAKANGNGRYVCEDCGEVFKFATALGSHRRLKHGIPGSSKSVLSLRKRQQAENKAKTNGNYTCPECGEKYKAASGLGRHWQIRHGVAGTSNAVMYKKRIEEEKQKAKVRVPYKKKGNKALAVPAKVTATRGVAEQPAPLAEKPGFFPISTEMVAYAAGKLESQAEQIARDNGLPVAEFVSRTADCLVVMGKRR